MPVLAHTTESKNQSNLKFKKVAINTEVTLSKYATGVSASRAAVRRKAKSRLRIVKNLRTFLFAAA